QAPFGGERSVHQDSVAFRNSFRHSSQPTKRRRNTQSAPKIASGCIRRAMASAVNGKVSAHNGFKQLKQLRLIDYVTKSM
ncbi:unnamed protein product, partial [Ceratitis capitata]